MIDYKVICANCGCTEFLAPDDVMTCRLCDSTEMRLVRDDEPAER